MKVLVTGATGQVGGSLLPMLLEGDAEVRALTRSPDSATELAALGAEAVIGDFDEPGTVEAGAAGCDAMFLVSTDGPSQVEQEINAARAAHAAGVRHIVKLSSSDAGQRPYIWSRNHGEIERALAGVGIPYSVIRPHFFMQNFLSLLRRTGERSAEVRAPGGNGRIGAIDAHDIARTAATLLLNGDPTHGHHLLTGPELVSFDDVAAAFSEGTGWDVAYVDQPESEFTDGLEGEGHPDDVVGVYAEIREGGLAILSDEVERITGSPPRTVREFASANRRVITEKLG